MKTTALNQIVALSLIHSIACGMPADNLISGGDFETVPPGCGTDCHSSCLPTVPGWTSSLGYQVDRTSYSSECPGGSLGPWRMPNPLGGQYMLSLQGSVCCGCNNNGWIEQTAVTIAGERYLLSFDVALDRLDQLRVSAGPAELLLVGSLETEQTGWSRQELPFTATGSTAVIRFSSESSTGSTPNPFGGCWEGDGCLLDNVTLVMPSPCPADLNDDGQVNGGDLSIVLGFWGTPAKTLPAADLNGDGTVDAADLAALLSGWGPCPK